MYIYGNPAIQYVVPLRGRSCDYCGSHYANPDDLKKNKQAAAEVLNGK